jgi:glycosyltransferase involved in cell wall biosynthesis
MGSEKQATTPQGVEPFVQIPGNYEGGTIDFYIDRIRPQLVAWLCDAFMVPWIKDRKKGWVARGNPKTMFYFPMDSDDVYEGMEDTLRTVDYRVAMSYFGQQKLKKETGLDSYFIPHCTDPSIFFPLSQQEKEAIRKDWGFENRFVVGCVGRNQSRKNPQRLLYVLKNFVDMHKDVVGFFHMDPNDPMQVSGGKTNMYKHAKEIGLNDHLYPVKGCPNCHLYFTGYPFFSGMPQQELNKVYNCFDVHAMSTTGEGFGITTIEAMSCGVPNVVTDYTTTQELLVDNGKCGEPVKYGEYDFINGGYNTKRVLPDGEDFLNKLEKLYNNQKLREQYGQIGREKVMKYYSLQAVLPQWNQLIGEILDQEVIQCQV